MLLRSLPPYSFSIAIITMLLFSCAKEGALVVEEPPQDSSIRYAFDHIEVVETKLFVGSPEGGVEVSGEIDPHAYFLTLFDKESKINYFKQDSLLVIGDTLIEYPIHNSANTYNYKVATNDSLFRWNPNADFGQYYGKMPSNKQEIVYERNYSRLIKIRQEGFSFLLDNRGEGFLSEDSFFSSNEMHFPNKSAMTQLTDTVLYTNVKYVYRR